MQDEPQYDKAVRNYSTAGPNYGDVILNQPMDTYDVLGPRLNESQAANCNPPPVRDEAIETENGFQNAKQPIYTAVNKKAETSAQEKDTNVWGRSYQIWGINKLNCNRLHALNEYNNPLWSCKWYHFIVAVEIEIPIIVMYTNTVLIINFCEIWTGLAVFNFGVSGMANYVNDVRPLLIALSKICQC